MERRLTAILAADVVGYSRLMSADEAGTLVALKTNRAELIEPTAAPYGGRTIKLMGDGTLMEFPSVVDAVGFAVEVQGAMRERNAAIEEDRQIVYRVGINIGDVIVEGDDIYGEGVNVAARLQEIAEPGGIAIAGSVYEQVQGKLDITFADFGQHQVKNIDRPIHVWRWPQGESPLAAPGAGEALPLPDKPSIAVLPFDNLSGDPDQEYFADGIAEDIITALSKFRWFFVIARNSSFSYKDISVDVKQVARELGVRYVLEGSVRKGGSRVRVSAQLIDATTGNHIWAERYDRELADIFELQDEMTETIVGALEPELGVAERERAKRKPPENLDAWDRYQRGIWHIWQMTKEDSEKADKLLQSAIELDPGFGAAYAHLAYLLFLVVQAGWTDDRDEALGRALEAGQRAVSLDEWDAFAHFALGRVLMMLGDFDTAISESQRAIDLNPNLALASYGLGHVLLSSGRPQEALPRFLTAVRQSPNAPFRWGFENLVGSAYAQLGEHAEAVVWLRKAAQHPNCNFWPHINLASAYVALDRREEARAAVDNALRMQPDLSVATISTIIGPMHRPSDDYFLDSLRRAGLPD